MDDQTQGHPDHEPSLAWFGHPPDAGVVAEPEGPVAEQGQPAGESDVYGRILTSALIVGGAVLLVRSRTFRLVTWRLAKVALTTWLPARLAAEVRRAWRDVELSESAHAEITDAGEASSRTT